MTQLNANARKVFAAKHAFTTGPSAFLSLLGIALLAAFSLWWAANLRADRLVGGRLLQVPCAQFLGADFEHNYYAVRHWVRGGNPFHGFPTRKNYAHYTYPPIVLPAFAWCSIFPRHQAVTILIGALIAIVSGAATLAWKTRVDLGLGRIPLPLSVALLLWSFPVLFALERGNYDLLALLAIVAATTVINRNTHLSAMTAGILLAAAAWLKMYPGIVLFGLIILRRYRVASIALIAGIIIGLADRPDVSCFIKNIRTSILTESGLHPYSHSLTSSWGQIWWNTPFGLVGRIPGTLAWALIVLPMVGWVSYHLYYCPYRLKLAYPYLLWLTAAGTFLPGIAHDYNAIYLPVAALAIWDLHDTPLVHVLMAYAMLWFQPFQLSIDPKALMLFKLSGLLAVGVSLVTKATIITSPKVELAPG